MSGRLGDEDSLIDALVVHSAEDAALGIKGQRHAPDGRPEDGDSVFDGAEGRHLRMPKDVFRCRLEAGYEQEVNALLGGPSTATLDAIAISSQEA
ncbi:MAG: hypothetical protein Q8R28_10580 [Dehalococcoidia bacterium]|nr:hypothetical protein [Dehalococcoidia bacterium]